MVMMLVVMVVIMRVRIPHPPERIEIVRPRSIVRTSTPIDRAAGIIRVSLAKPAAAAGTTNDQNK
jgi:hypothetical protein